MEKKVTIKEGMDIFLQKCRERYMGLYWTFWK